MDDAAIASPALTTVFLIVLGLGLAVWVAIAQRYLGGKSLLRWRRRRRVPWGVDGLLLPILMVAAPILGTLTEAGEVGGVEPASVTVSDAIGISGVYLVVMACAAALVVRASDATADDFGVGRRLNEPVRGQRAWLGDAAIGLAACLATLPLVYAAQALLVTVLGVESAHPVLQGLANASAPEVLAAGWLAVVVAPISEEFVFRVLLQGWLERYASREALWPAVASAAVFAIAHQGQGYAPVALFFFGLVSGYVYQRTHRLAPCVCMHVAFNAISFSLAVAMASESG
ncbi:MAG: CPBP family intramembrane glutamic endopeptidase [Planctomycetota bacterium]